MGLLVRLAASCQTSVPRPNTTVVGLGLRVNREHATLSFDVRLV